MIYGNESCPVKEEGLLGQESNDVRLVRCTCSVRPEERITVEDFKTSLKLKRMRERVMDKTL